MQQIVADRITGAQGDLSKERAALDLAYDMLEQRMASRTWVAESHFTMADCAAPPRSFTPAPCSGSLTSKPGCAPILNA